MGGVGEGDEGGGGWGEEMMVMVEVKVCFADERGGEWRVCQP